MAADLHGDQRKLGERRWDANLFPFSDNVGSLTFSYRPVSDIDRGDFDLLRSLQMTMPAKFDSVLVFNLTPFKARSGAFFILKKIRFIQDGISDKA
jgi:hypothetical protein